MIECEGCSSILSVYTLVVALTLIAGSVPLVSMY